jgi:DNA-directed RNA polymerase subunit RPC12/RpoP
MPRLLFEFKCGAGHVTDNFVDTETRSIKCPVCGSPASKLISKPRLPISQGWDTSLPTAALKWEKMQRAKNSGKIRDANNERYGGPRPSDIP